MFVLVVVNVRNLGLSWEVLDDREAGIVANHGSAAPRRVTARRASAEGRCHRTNHWDGHYDPSLRRLSQDPSRLGRREQPVHPRASMGYGHRLVAWSDNRL